jgi:hypothetical protein
MVFRPLNERSAVGCVVVQGHTVDNDDPANCVVGVLLGYYKVTVMVLTIFFELHV